MLKVDKGTDRIRVETAAVAFEWDLARGGQLTGCELRRGEVRHSLWRGEPAPNLTLELADGMVSLADRPVEVTFGREDDQCFVFSTRGELGDCFVVEQKFEAFRDGVVFCEFAIVLKPGRRVKVRSAEMHFGLDVLSANNLRVNTMTRDPYPKQDVTCIHVLSDAQVCLDRDERIERDQLLAICGLDLGWNECRYYSNRVEMVVEDSTSIGHGLLGRTRTLAGPMDGKWRLRWRLCEDSDETLSEPFFYRNRWAMMCGAARTEAGPAADRALRNNAMAGRVCHVMYPYVRAGEEWPWTSVPVRQTFYQDAQLACGNPELERIDEAAALGVNILVLHQFWMTNGGSNGEPMAEYRAFDPDWLRAFVARAHERGMRVALYTRGIERYSMYSDFFEQFLTRDRDGLYVDWATPFGLGYCKTSSLHFSAYDYFMFARALRNRVGDNGLLIGHSAVQTFLATGLFDAVLAGEFSVMHSGLLSTPEISASYSMLGGCGVSLISGNSADRAVFSSQRAAGFCAGLGYSAHPFMEADRPFGECSAYLHPLWRLWSALGSDPIRVRNPAVGERHAAKWSDDRLHPIVYQAADGTTLALVTNLGEDPVSGCVELDFEALGAPRAAVLTPVEAPGTHALVAEGGRIVVEAMPPYHFGGMIAARGDRG